VDIRDKINGDIKSGRYKTQNFIEDVTRRYWGIILPMMKHQLQLSPYDNQDLLNSLMSMHELPGYYKERSNLAGSGVRGITPEDGHNIANRGGLVLVVRDGEASIMAPSEEPFPLVYKTDELMTTEKLKDFRGFDFYHIDPEEYARFNMKLEETGLSERDIHAKYGSKAAVDLSYAPNQNYNILHGLIGTMDV